MTSAVGLNATNSWSYASGAYGAASGSAAPDAKAKAANPDTSARDSNATSVTLSEEAKAYLEANPTPRRLRWRPWRRMRANFSTSNMPRSAFPQL